MIQNQRTSGSASVLQSYQEPKLRMASRKIISQWRMYGTTSLWDITSEMEGKVFQTTYGRIQTGGKVTSTTAPS